MYVETDFLIALVKPDDRLNERAETLLATEGDIHTSLLAYVELLVEAYEPGHGIAYDVPRVVANLLEIVPIKPVVDEHVALAAATYLDGHAVTPFDAFHAGIAVTNDGRIGSSDEVYDDLDLDRVPLEPDSPT